MSASTEQADRLAIRELLENWAVWRDAGGWERFRTVWHPEGRMMATWFQGIGDEFIKVSREGFEQGVRILHFLGGISIDLAGSRAILQTKMTISQRAKVDGVECRAVQRSLHGPQREHCIDSSDSDAIAPVTHVVHVVEAEDIGGEGSQASEDAGIAADPTVVLAEADIADIVQSVLNPPMAADGVSAGCGGQSDVSNEVGDLAGSLPQAGRGGALERVAGDADDRRDVIGPFGVGQGGAGSKHLDHTDFIA